MEGRAMLNFEGPTFCEIVLVEVFNGAENENIDNEHAWDFGTLLQKGAYYTIYWRNGPPICVGDVKIHS